jgi:Uma2 family endonuclease
MVVDERVMTVEEFWAQYAGQPYELVEGRVEEVTPTGYLHGSVTSRTLAHLIGFVEQHGLGDVVGAETGFHLSATVMRAADAAFIGNEKLARITDPDKYLPFAPDLAVEVVSPGDTAADIQHKVDAYLQAGTALVWVIYPSLKKVIVYRPDGTARTIPEGGALDGGEVLPGLAIPVAALFPSPAQ